MKTITDKMAARGAESLSDAELLAVLTDDEQTAGALLAACGGALARIASEDAARLRMVGGLGLRRARLLLAAAEFGRRVAASRAAEADVIATSDDVVALFRPQLETLAYEECWAVYLTSSNRIIERQRISQGGVQGTVVDHRLIVKRALELLATQLVLIYNHPSGAAAPSPQDKVLTERVAQAAALFDIRLLDHIIVPARGAGVALFLTSGIAAYCYDSDGNERNQKFHRSRHLFGSFHRGGTQKRGLDPTSTAEVLDDPNGRMVEYARAEKQREHQPSFLTVRESVQFSAGRKKPMHFFVSYVGGPWQAAVANIEINSLRKDVVPNYFVLL